jgi:hypothetical protein
VRTARADIAHACAVRRRGVEYPGDARKLRESGLRSDRIGRRAASARVVEIPLRKVAVTDRNEPIRRSRRLEDLRRLVEIPPLEAKVTQHDEPIASG